MSAVQAPLKIESFKTSPVRRRRVTMQPTPFVQAANSRSGGFSPVRKMRPDPGSDWRVRSPTNDSVHSEASQLSSGLSRGELVTNGSAKISSDVTSEDGYEDKTCNRYGFFIESQEAQFSDPQVPLSLILKREKKWLFMLQHWDKFINNRWKKVRNRCRKGIPHSVRGQAWLHLVGAQHSLRRHPGLFEQLESERGNENIIEEISKDLHRQFPSHEMFASRHGHGQQDLFRVLKAFSIFRPEIGYCQGQAPLAAVLLMHMPAEHAFWSLVAICEHYLPGYFSPGLEAIQIHGDMLNALLKNYSPGAYKILKKQKIEPILYMTEWFMCIFSRTLPWTSVLRIWDMFLCEGIKVVFKAAIVIITMTLENSAKKCPTMYETLELLRHVPAKNLTEPILIDRILKLDLHDRDLQREHQHQESIRRKAKKKANKQKD